MFGVLTNDLLLVFATAVQQTTRLEKLVWFYKFCYRFYIFSEKRESLFFFSRKKELFTPVWAFAVAALHLPPINLSSLTKVPTSLRAQIRAMEEAAAPERKRPRDGDVGPSTAASGEAQYVYLPIADALKAPGARVCLFAAVSEIGAAVRSRGTGEPPSRPHFRVPPPPLRAGFRVLVAIADLELFGVATGLIIFSAQMCSVMVGEIRSSFRTRFASCSDCKC